MTCPELRESLESVLWRQFPLRCESHRCGAVLNGGAKNFSTANSNNPGWQREERHLLNWIPGMQEETFLPVTGVGMRFRVAEHPA